MFFVLKITLKSDSINSRVDSDHMRVTAACLFQDFTEEVQGVGGQVTAIYFFTPVSCKT